jgi:tetratricopeptide (TPR) repeat protein
MSSRHLVRAAFVIGALTALVSCQKQKGRQEQESVRREEAGPSVAVSTRRAAFTVAVLGPEAGPSAAWTLFGIFGRDMAGRLSRCGEVTVPVWPRQAFESDAGRSANARLIVSPEPRGTEMSWTIDLDTGGGKVVRLCGETAAMEDVYSISRETAVRAAGLLNLDSAAAGFPAPQPSGSVFRAYMEGMSRLDESGGRDLDRSVAVFKAAVREDSTFAAAWKGLSAAYLAVIRSQSHANRAFTALAQDAALRAVRLDSTDGEARFLLGEALFEWGDRRSGERECSAAVRRSPNLAEAWARIGSLAAAAGDGYTTGLDAFSLALELSPFPPGAAAGKANLLMGLGRYAEAGTLLESSIGRSPGSAALHSLLALSMYYQKRLPAASEEASRASALDPPAAFPHAVLAMIDAVSGKSDEALSELVNRVEPAAGRDAGLAAATAAVYSLLGRNGVALEWFDKSLDLGYADFQWISNDPNFDGLRNDPRFAERLERLKSARPARTGGEG